jgi:hypothetical protein
VRYLFKTSWKFQLISSISLTLGLMGLDELHLRVLATSSEDLTEKGNAQKGPNGIIDFLLYPLIFEKQY